MTMRELVTDEEEVVAEDDDIVANCLLFGVVCNCKKVAKEKYHY
jgi:hypothetical protein